MQSLSIQYSSQNECNWCVAIIIRDGKPHIFVYFEVSCQEHYKWTVLPKVHYKSSDLIIFAACVPFPA